eukprot:1240342-Rhodomonas_salina.1
MVQKSLLRLWTLGKNYRRFLKVQNEGKLPPLPAVGIASRMRCRSCANPPASHGVPQLCGPTRLMACAIAFDRPMFHRETSFLSPLQRFSRYPIPTNLSQVTPLRD